MNWLIGILINISFIFPVFSTENGVNFYIMDVPPYGLMKNNQMAGFYVDIATLLEKRSKSHINKFLVPYPRAVKTVLSEKNSLTIMFDTQELESKSTKIAPLFNVNNYILMSATKKEVNSLSSINGLIVGRMRGGCLDINEEKYKIKFEDFSTFEIGLNQLVKGRIDGICGTRVAMTYFLKKMKYSVSDFGPFVLTSKRTVYLHASPSMTTENKKKWVRVVTRIKKDPEFKRIIENLE